MEIRPATSTDLAALLPLLENAAATGDVDSLSPFDRSLWLAQVADAPGDTLVALRDGGIAGAITPFWETLVVAPPARRQGVGRALVEAALARNDELILAPPPRSDAAMAFLRASGFAAYYTLVQLRLDDIAAIPAPAPAPGWTIRQHRVDQARGYVALLNRVFGELVVPLHFDEERVVAAQQRPEFDPSHTAVLVRDDDPNTLLGFCRAVPPDAESGDTAGEISILGLDAAVRGHGLGRAMLRWGIAHLRAAGCDAITLSAVESDVAAFAMYRSEGFVETGRSPRWRRFADPAGAPA